MTVAMIVWVAMTMGMAPVEAPPVVADFECAIDPFNPPPEWAADSGYEWCWFSGEAAV
jgi:hypothetical protein